MEKAVVSREEFLSSLSLSPEYWLSSTAAKSVTDGVPFPNVASISSKGVANPPPDALVLDTGNSDRGLLTLPAARVSANDLRKSHKKRVPEGSVLISRLRPYLRQVCYIPLGLSEILGVSDILCSTEYYVISSNQSGKSIAFLVPWLLSDVVQSVFERATTGGHHPRFSDDLLMGMSIPTEVMETSEDLSRKVEAASRENVESQLKMRSFIEQVQALSSYSYSVNPSSLNSAICQGVG